VVVWLAVCVGGLVLLWRYKATPAASGAAPARWPAGSAIPRTPGESSLVMLVHPRCPCSRASLSELNQVMNRAPDVSATLLFVLPDGVDEAWAHGESWERAHQIPRTRVLLDRGGAEARRFRVATSGHTLLYDAGGALLFSGGVTGARGHEGDNAGRQQLMAALAASSTGGATARVYGCALEEGR
jgi:hypothetical protein